MLVARFPLLALFSLFLLGGCLNPPSPSNASSDVGTTTARVSVQALSAPEWIVATPGNGEIFVDWAPVQGATGYNLYWNTTGNPTTSDQKIAGVVPPFTHVGLQSGTAYFYTVTTLSENNESSPSTTTSNEAVNVEYLSIPQNSVGYHDFPAKSANGISVSGSTLYVATPSGLAISQDGGSSFVTRTTANGLGHNTVNAVFTVGNTVYAATLNGLAISTDGGTTFTNKSSGNGLGSNMVNSVYAQGSLVLAGTGQYGAGGSTGGLSLSTDGGNTFTNWALPTATIPGLGTIRLVGQGSVAGVFASGGLIFGAYGSTDSIYGGGLCISSDGGNSFISRTTANGLGGNFLTGVFVSAGNIYVTARTVGPYPGGLSISRDGGNTFTNLTTAEGLGSNFVNGVYVDGNTVFAATSGGLSVSSDGGETFANRTTANGLGSNDIFGVYAAGTTIYAATYGGLSISIDGGESFINKTTSTGTSPTLNAVAVYGNSIVAGGENGVYTSTDGGRSFTNRTTSNGLFSNTIYGISVVGNTIYAATQLDLSISTDGGNTFTNAGLNDCSVDSRGGVVCYTNVNGHTSLGTGWTVFVDGSNVYVGGDYGVAISNDGGATFTMKTASNGIGVNAQLKYPYVRGVYADGNRVFAATGGGLSISTDGGNTFTNKPTLSFLGANTVSGVYAEGSTIFVTSTVGGVAISTDGGNTFSNSSDRSGLDSLDVYTLFVDGINVYLPTTSGLSISTNGAEQFTNWGLAQGISGSVFGAATDGGALYVATNSGLFQSTQ